MIMGLTRRQRELLTYLRTREIAPSFSEMQGVLGLSSKSGVHRLIEALEERGYITRSPNRARSIELTPKALRFDTTAPMERVRRFSSDEVIHLPLHGRIS